MAGATLGKTWRDVQKELYSPEEIAASDARVKLAIALSKARKAQGLTQKELSEKTGIRQPVISRLEHGDTATQIDFLIKLVTAMNLKMQVVPLDA